MTTEQDKTREALLSAIQMETDGKEFYLKASQESGNELGRKLLQKLADEEDVHRKNFEEIYATIQNKKAWPRMDFQPAGDKGLKTVFYQAIEEMDTAHQKTADTELGAVEEALVMENKTYDFYINRGKNAAHDAETEFYSALASQERIHHQVLLDYSEYLTDPAAWFVQKEHPSLDGG
ncbi:ferritin family protein [Chloroflexota bacterium]